MFILDAKDVQLKTTVVQWLVVLDYVIHIIKRKKMKITNWLIIIDILNLIVLGISILVGNFQISIIVPILWTIVALLAHLEIKDLKKML